MDSSLAKRMLFIPMAVGRLAVGLLPEAFLLSKWHHPAERMQAL